MRDEEDVLVCKVDDGQLVLSDDSLHSVNLYHVIPIAQLLAKVPEVFILVQF